MKRERSSDLFTFFSTISTFVGISVDTETSLRVDGDIERRRSSTTRTGSSSNSSVGFGDELKEGDSSAAAA